MSEHVRLLVSEPERATLAIALQALEQSVARRLIGERRHFWQARYYDFNVWSAMKRVEKLRYIRGTRFGVASSRIRKVGSGAAFGITRPVLKGWSRLNRSGPEESVSAWVCLCA
jgi:hypothetical protein